MIPTRFSSFMYDFDNFLTLLEMHFDNFEGIEQFESVSKFRLLDVPPLVTVDTLALFLGVSPELIEKLHNQSDKNYRSFKIEKKDGKSRKIETPKTFLKVIQWWILDNILAKIDLPDQVFGFVQGKCIRDNAAFHQGANHILSVDISNFFPSIKFKQVVKVFESINYSASVSRFLAKLCCLNGSVPQGAPTSPTLANLVVREMDYELIEFAKNENFKYSRYADDMTFSSIEKIDIDFVLKIQKIIQKYGFSLNKKKTRFAGSGYRMEITGVVINKILQPKRKWRKQIRANLHNLSLKNRITRRELSRLYGLRGFIVQYPESKQLTKYKFEIDKILKEKKDSVYGIGDKPILPNRLTCGDAKVLVYIEKNLNHFEIAIKLDISEREFEKKLNRIFKKIGVSSDTAARQWTLENI